MRPWDGLHSAAAPAILECGGKRSATPLWLARRGDPAQSKRRRRCALPAHSKRPACRLSCGLLLVKQNATRERVALRLSTSFHKYGHVCDEGFLAQTRRERRAYPSGVCKE